MPNIIFTHKLRNALLDILEASAKELGIKGKKFLQTQAIFFHGAFSAIDHINGPGNSCAPTDISIALMRGKKIERKSLEEALPSQEMHSFVPPMQVLDLVKVVTVGLNSVGEETLKYLYNNHVAWRNEQLCHILDIRDAVKDLEGLPESEDAGKIRAEVTDLAALAEANESAFVILTSY